MYIRVQKGISYTIKLRSTLDRLKCFHGFSCLSNPKRFLIKANIISREPSNPQFPAFSSRFHAFLPALNKPSRPGAKRDKPLPADCGCSRHIPAQDAPCRKQGELELPSSMIEVARFPLWETTPKGPGSGIGWRNNHDDQVNCLRKRLKNFC